METFFIRYNNIDSTVYNKAFIVREDKDYLHHYLIADGKTHTGGGKLLKRYCIKITGEDLSRNDILFMNNIIMTSNRDLGERKFSRGEIKITKRIDVVPTKSIMLNLFGNIIGIENW